MSDPYSHRPARQRLQGRGESAVPKTIKTEQYFLSSQRKTTIFILRLLLGRQG